MKPLIQIRPKLTAPCSENKDSESGALDPAFSRGNLEFDVPVRRTSNPKLRRQSFCRSESSDSLGQKQNFATVPPLQTSHFRLAVPDTRPKKFLNRKAWK